MIKLQNVCYKTSLCISQERHRIALQVRSLIGDRMSLLTGSLSMVLISWVLCFIISWRFGVLIIFTHPIVIFCYYIKKVFEHNIIYFPHENVTWLHDSMDSRLCDVGYLFYSL